MFSPIYNKNSNFSAPKGEFGELIASGSIHDIFEKSANPIVNDYIGGAKG